MPQEPLDDLMASVALLADSARAADLAAQVHRIAASALLHLGAPDPLRAAAVRCSLGHVLMRQGRFVNAERVSV
ncbi:MAG: hypothetical protein ACRD0H_25400, partial [Actinomycetes bacterium]